MLAFGLGAMSHLASWAIVTDWGCFSFSSSSHCFGYWCNPLLGFEQFLLDQDADVLCLFPSSSFGFGSICCWMVWRWIKALPLLSLLCARPFSSRTKFHLSLCCLTTSFMLIPEVHFFFSFSLYCSEDGILIFSFSFQIKLLSERRLVTFHFCFFWLEGHWLWVKSCYVQAFKIIHFFLVNENLLREQRVKKSGKAYLHN